VTNRVHHQYKTHKSDSLGVLMMLLLLLLVEHHNEVDVVMVVGERRRVPTRNWLPMMAQQEGTPRL
jgi:hypothetical protein